MTSSSTRGNVMTDNKVYRMDGRVERLCIHGIGHPISAPKEMGKAGFVHGCDGCCISKAESKKVRGEQ